MEYEETVSDLETFGISLADERVFGILQFAIENENWDPSTTIDELISEATNQRVTKIDSNFISQFVKKLQDAENVKPDIKTVSTSLIHKSMNASMTKIEQVKIESSEVFKGILSSDAHTDVKLVQTSLDTTALNIVPMVPGLEIGDEIVIDAEMMGDVEEVLVSGRVVSVPDRLSQSKAIILSPYYGKKIIDFSDVSDSFVFHEQASLFIALLVTSICFQAIHVEGVYEAGIVKAKKIIHESPPDLAPVLISSVNSDSCTIFSACGPFNKEDDVYPTKLNQLFFNAKERKAKLIILFGPVLSFSKTAQKREASAMALLNTFFETLTSLAEDFEGSVVVVPGIEDDIYSPCGDYPCPPYPKFRDYSKVYLLPNPCVFTFAGLTIAVNNYDNLMCLAKSRLVTAPQISGNRLQAFLTEVLSEGLIIPSQAVQEELVNNKFKEMPHIIISTSKLQRFATKCCESFYVNLKHSKGNPGMCYVNCHLERKQSDKGSLKITAEFLDK
ncbi:hypothetical protein FO519_007035 [Halicephalobus sp. NKZ332]|nr:hypothetical protein FO519_007035 [Halicephalobus sp. NKZ332]